MKAVVRSSIVSIVALFGILSVSVSAQAYFSGDEAREQSTEYVVSGEHSYDGDIIRTAKTQPVSLSPIPDWEAGAGVEGHEAIQNQSKWVTKETGQHSRRAIGEQYDTNNKIPVDYPILFLGWTGEHWFDEYKDIHNEWQEGRKEHEHHRHWVKQEADPAPTPIPPAALLLGSGLSIIAGLRASRRKREDLKGKVQEVLC